MTSKDSHQQPSEKTSNRLASSEGTPGKNKEASDRFSTNLHYEPASPGVTLERSVGSLLAKTKLAPALDRQSVAVSTEAEFLIGQVETLSTLFLTTEKINSLVGDDNNGAELGATRIALAFQKIVALNKQARESPGIKFLSKKQKIFGAACQNNPQGIGSQSVSQTLSWYEPLSAHLRIVSLSDEFPEMLPYLRASPSTQDKARHLTERLSEASSRLSEAKTRKSEAARSEVRQAEADMQQIEQEIATLFSSARNIDLLQVPGLSERIQVELAVDDRILEASVKLIQGLGARIASLCSAQHSDEARTVQLPVFSVDGRGHLASQVYSLELPEQSTSEIDKAMLARLLNSYLDLREALLATFESLQMHPAREISGSAGMTALRSSLRSVFPGPFGKTCEVINFLDSTESPHLAAMTAKLLTSRTLSNKDAEPLEQEYILQRKEGLELVVTLSRRLLFDNEVLAPEVKSVLGTSEIGPIVVKCDEVRKLLQARRYKELATYLDKAIKEQATGNSSFIENVCLLGILSALGQNGSCARALKVRLTSIDLVPKLCQSILEKGAKTSATLANLVERSRASIVKNLSYNLDDYLGQDQLKQRMSSMFKHNLMTLARLELFPSVPAKLALYNGFLLYGIPGAGKTFLVQCLANHLGIPLIKISREEMIRALHDGQSRQDKADGLGRFLESKADEAHAQMRMNGAAASIIFIDEMESLFLKRDPSTSSREELDETNQMLRILEEVMQKHFDIFFMGATNNVQFVDDAAIRVGRFGIRLQLKPVDQEDAKALVRGVCEMLNISFEELSACASFKDLCEVCCGMVPLPIQNAMVNRYVACAAPPSDPAQLIEMFIESVRVMKELTTNC